MLPLIAESWAENGVCRIPYSFSLLCLLIPFQAQTRLGGDTFIEVMIRVQAPLSIPGTDPIRVRIRVMVLRVSRPV